MKFSVRKMVHASLNSESFSSIPNRIKGSSIIFLIRCGLHYLQFDIRVGTLPKPLVVK
jgi:hypothetical protein